MLLVSTFDFRRPAVISLVPDTGNLMGALQAVLKNPPINTKNQNVKVSKSKITLNYHTLVSQTRFKLVPD